jgi:hypothetical protein
VKVVSGCGAGPVFLDELHWIADDIARLQNDLAAAKDERGKRDGT